MDRDEVQVHKNAKRERGRYSATLTELAWSIKDLLYGIPRLHVALCFYFCVCWFFLPNIFLKLINIFVFFVFILVDASVFSSSSSIPAENLQKIFLLSRKIFCGRKLSCTRLDLSEILLRDQKGQSQAGSIAPSCPLG